MTSSLNSVTLIFAIFSFKSHTHKMNLRSIQKHIDPALLQLIQITGNLQMAHSERHLGGCQSTFVWQYLRFLLLGEVRSTVSQVFQPAIWQGMPKCALTKSLLWKKLKFTFWWLKRSQKVWVIQHRMSDNILSALNTSKVAEKWNSHVKVTMFW